MLRKYKNFLKRRLQLLSGIVFGLVVVVWIVSLWFPFFADWLFQHHVFGLVLIGLMVEVLALLDELMQGSGIQTNVGSDQNAELNKLRDYVRHQRHASADTI